jgi:hypothetical protein
MKIENEITQDHNFLLKALKVEGFIALYFSQLPKSRNCLEAFNEINEKYFDITGDYRYSGFHSFRNQLSHYIKNKNQK